MAHRSGAPISLPTGSGGLTAFCPPFRGEAHRLQGHLFAFDQIISESPKRLDPLTPMIPTWCGVLHAADAATGVGLIPPRRLRGRNWGRQHADRGLKRMAFDTR